MVTSPLANTSLPPLSPLVTNLSDLSPSSPRWRHYWTVPYLDFAKAFDTVPNSGLLRKLREYGMDRNIMRWIKVFLWNCSQVANVNGEESFASPLLSGIPQGSVLGPTLFVIYIDDLPDHINSDTFMFTDDTKILRCITSREDSDALDIHKLEEWSDKWLLRFSTYQHVLTLGKTADIMHTHKHKRHSNSFIRHLIFIHSFIHSR